MSRETVVRLQKTEYALVHCSWTLFWLRRAIALSPNNADAHGILGLLLVAEGRTQEGLEESRVAQQLDPKNDHLSLVLYYDRDYDASIKVVERMLRKDPNNGISHCLLFSVYFKKGSYAEAIDQLAECYSLYGYPKAGSNLRQAFATSGYRGAMRQFAKDVGHLQDTHQAYLPGNLVTAYMSATWGMETGPHSTREVHGWSSRRHVPYSE